MSKKRFLCIQRSQAGGECTPPTPEQMQQMYANFMAWQEKFGSCIVDMGGRLGGGGVVSATAVTDGPYVESKEVVGGYMIVEAESLAEAQQIAQASPGVAMPGTSVEVREIMTSS